MNAGAGDVIEADRNPRSSVAAVKAIAAELAAITTRPWTLMEVCGGQTHAIVRWGLDQLLPEGLRLIHGPGCPVCVTPAGTIEQALALARRPEVILCSYGDMLRVPGEGRDTLLSVRAAGGDVRLLTAPLQALELARSHPDRQVVFLAVGFETTAPATALLARQALTLGAGNLSLLAAHVRVSPAMEAILADPANRVQGFLAAGHVCSVLGTGELEPLVGRWRVPVVVTGFEPAELMAGVLACVRQLEGGEARVENAYGSVVRPEGNPAARKLLEEVFEPCDRPWRGLGLMHGGGLALRGPYRALAAAERFGLPEAGTAAAAIRACGPCHEQPTVTAAAAIEAEAEPLTRAAAADPADAETAGSACNDKPLTEHRRRPAADPVGRRGGIGTAEQGLCATPAGSAALRACLSKAAQGHEHHGTDADADADREADAGPCGGIGRAGSPRVNSDAAAAASQAASADNHPCIAGSILRGLATPEQCTAFGTSCTPEQPLGAPMVSSEGTCAAYFLYRHRAGARAKQEG